MNLIQTEFNKVILGAVFFDPATGQKFQKVDEPFKEERLNRYGQEFNAVGEKNKYFQYDDEVKAHKNHIKNG